MPGSNASVGNTLTRGRAFQELLLARVRQASREIFICTTTLEFDAFGQALLSELEYACQRGVQVRCLIDARGSRKFIRNHPVLLTRLESQIRIASQPMAAPNLIIFDRAFAVTGDHVLHETEMDNDAVSHIIAGDSVKEMTDEFESAWCRMQEISVPTNTQKPH